MGFYFPSFGQFVNPRLVSIIRFTLAIYSSPFCFVKGLFIMGNFISVALPSRYIRITLKIYVFFGGIILLIFMTPINIRR